MTASVINPLFSLWNIFVTFLLNDPLFFLFLLIIHTGFFFPLGNRELKQTRRRRKQERHLKMKLCVSAVIFQLFKIITLENCVLTILELNWNQRLGHKKTKLNICHHMLTSSTQLQNWSFHVVERTRTSTKCEKNEICTCKACKNTIFHCQICKFVGFLLPSSSWLLKLPNDV